MNIRTRLAALLFLVSLAGCRGAGSGSSMVPSAATLRAPGSASFSIVLPAPAKGAQSAMKSVTVSLIAVNGSAPAAAIAPEKMNLSTTTPGCSLAASGALTCVAKLAVPPGNDSFSVTTYAQPNETGAQVSTSQVTTAISAGRSTTCVKKSQPVKSE